MGIFGAAAKLFQNVVLGIFAKALFCRIDRQRELFVVVQFVLGGDGHLSAFGELLNASAQAHLAIVQDAQKGGSVRIVVCLRSLRGCGNYSHSESDGG
jgi:hypothetical protein